MSDTAVKGLRELQRALDTLPVNIERNIMRGALRQGAQVIAQTARALAPVSEPNAKNARLYGGRTGLLRDSIRVSMRLKRGRILARIIAGGKVKGGGDAYYARWVETGTRPHTIRARDAKALATQIGFVMQVEHPGARPRPFLRPAMDQSAQAALEAVRAYVRQRLASKHGLTVPEAEPLA